MHEFGITSRIVDSVRRVAEDNQPGRVVRVDLLIGQLTFLSVAQVKLCYEILTRGSALEGSELAVQEGEGLVRCVDCQHERQVSCSVEDDPNKLEAPLPLFSCSECGGKVAIVRGKECQITGVALED